MRSCGRRSTATGSRHASTSSSATRARPRRRRSRVLLSSSTATTPTRARAPTTSAGARSCGRAATSSSTTQSTSAATGTYYPGIARLVGEIERDDAAASGSRSRLDRALHAPRREPRRGRPLLQRPRGHAGRARVARGIETVVVDNGSDDGSAEAVAERFPDVELVRTGVNLGFAGGNNVGIRRALDARRRLGPARQQRRRGRARARRRRWPPRRRRAPMPACSRARCSSPTRPALVRRRRLRPDARVRGRHDGLRRARRRRRTTLARRRPRDRRGDGRLARRDRARGPARRGALPLRRGSRVVPADPRGGLRGRLRAGREGAAPRLGGDRRRGSPTSIYYETRNMLAVVERYRRCRAGCRRSGEGSSCAPRVLADARDRRRRGRRCAAGAISAAADGAASLGRWRTSAAASTDASSSSCSTRALSGAT